MRSGLRAAIALALLSMAVQPLGGCGKKPDAAAGGPPPGAPGGPPATVMVSAPLVRHVVDWDDYIGRFEAINTVQVRARVAGFINTVNFKDGERVTKGQTLFTIDPRTYQATLDQARGDAARAASAVDLARADLGRAETLLGSKAISRENYETRRSTLAQNQAALATAQAVARNAALNLSFTRVVAPISGRVSDRRVDPGNTVNGGDNGAGDVLTTIVSVDPIHFTFTGSEALYLKYQALNRQGLRPSSRSAPNPVDIRLQNETDYRWKGRMVFVDNALDASSGTIRAKALVDNPDGYLTPGLFGHLRLLGSGAYDAMMIPDTAVVTDQARKLVYVVARDGTVQGRPVELGPLYDGLRIVKGGISRTDSVVIGGVQMAHPGAKVKTKAAQITVPAPGASPSAGGGEGTSAVPAASSATPAGGR